MHPINSVQLRKKKNLPLRILFQVICKQKFGLDLFSSFKRQREKKRLVLKDLQIFIVSAKSWKQSNVTTFFFHLFLLVGG